MAYLCSLNTSHLLLRPATSTSAVTVPLNTAHLATFPDSGVGHSCCLASWRSESWKKSTSLRLIASLVDHQQPLTLYLRRGRLAKTKGTLVNRFSAAKILIYGGKNQNKLLRISLNTLVAL